MFWSETKTKSHYNKAHCQYLSEGLMAFFILNSMGTMGNIVKIGYITLLYCWGSSSAFRTGRKPRVLLGERMELLFPKPSGRVLLGGAWCQSGVMCTCTVTDEFSAVESKRPRCSWEIPAVKCRVQVSTRRASIERNGKSKQRSSGEFARRSAKRPEASSGCKKEIVAPNVKTVSSKRKTTRRLTTEGLRYGYPSLGA